MKILPLARAAAVVASGCIDATAPLQFVFIAGCPDWIDEDPLMVDRYSGSYPGFL
jgi:hypothetical protein